MYVSVLEFVFLWVYTHVALSSPSFKDLRFPPGLTILSHVECSSSHKAARVEEYYQEKSPWNTKESSH